MAAKNVLLLDFNLFVASFTNQMSIKRREKNDFLVDFLILQEITVQLADGVVEINKILLLIIW